MKGNIKDKMQGLTLKNPNAAPQAPNDEIQIKKDVFNQYEEVKQEEESIEQLNGQKQLLESLAIAQTNAHNIMGNNTDDQSDNSDEAQ